MFNGTTNCATTTADYRVWRSRFDWVSLTRRILSGISNIYNNLTEEKMRFLWAIHRHFMPNGNDGIIDNVVYQMLSLSSGERRGEKGKRDEGNNIHRANHYFKINFPTRRWTPAENVTSRDTIKRETSIYICAQCSSERWIWFNKRRSLKCTLHFIFFLLLQYSSDWMLCSVQWVVLCVHKHIRRSHFNCSTKTFSSTFVDVNAFTLPYVRIIHTHTRLHAYRDGWLGWYRIRIRAFAANLSSDGNGIVPSLVRLFVCLFAVSCEA